MVEFSNLGLLENQSIIKVNVSAVQSITDNLPNSGALTDIAQVSNQSIIIANQSTILDTVSNDATLGNQSTILQYNQTIDSVVDGIKTVTDILPDSGALSSLGTVVNQSLILTDGDNVLVNTSSLIASNSTIDTVVDSIIAVTDLLPNSGALTSIGQVTNQSIMIANQSNIIQRNATIDAVVDGIKTITDALPDAGALTSLGTIVNQSLMLTDGDLIIANTSSIINNISSGEIGDATIGNQSTILQYNQTIDAVVDNIKTVTDLLPDNGALSSLGMLANQSLILVDGNNILSNGSSLIGSNSTIDGVVDGIKVITDALPDSGALTSIGTLANQTLMLADGDNLLTNTTSLIISNSTIDTVVDAIKVVADALPDSGALTSIGQIANQSLIMVDGDNLLANTSSLIASNTTIDVVVDAIKTVTDVLPDSGALTSLGTMENQSHLLKEVEHLSYVFPESSADVITMHTGVANTYGPYNVIKDGSNNTFSEKFNNTEGHISSMLVEEASVADITFVYEISYGATHTPLITYRFHSATNQIGAVMKSDISPPVNPAGEILYYRGMAENASVNAEVSFRYHFHS